MSHDAVDPPAAAVALLAQRIEESAHPAHRFVLGIAGSPGSGKTTLARAVARAVGPHAVHVPMDGFHLADATLERLGRRERKGALDTFDGWGFVALLRRLRAETDHVVYAPSFRREVGEPIAGEIAVTPDHRIVIVEGNYLLVDAEPWAGVRDLLDAAWFCAAVDAVREARLVDRHQHHGRDREAATAWAREVDGANAVLIEASADRADLVVSGENGAVIGGAPVRTADRP